MYVPDERRSYRRLFTGLSLALAAATLWALVDETWTRRPWKEHQAAYIELRPEEAPAAVRQLVIPGLDNIDRCTTCHAGIDDPELVGDEVPGVLRTHPRHEELLGPHPPERFGCTSCHQGQGPALTAESAHGDELWPWPLLTGAMAESSCLACHPEEESLAGAPTLSLGRQGFRELGCSGCHLTGLDDPEPSAPPSLRHVGSKLHEGSLLAWIRDPRPHRPGAHMPLFWPGADEDPALAALRDEESLAIAAYLVEVSEPLADPGLEPDPVLAAEGREIFEAVGCRGCHLLGDEEGPEAAPVEDAWADFDEPGSDEVVDPWLDFAEEIDPAAPWAPERGTTVDQPLGFGPVLGAEGARARFDFLAVWLRDPAAYWPEARMPDMRLDDEQVLALASWLSTEGAEHRPETPPELVDPEDTLVQRGGELIDLYGCQGCHDIPGFEEARRPGPELGGFGDKGVAELFFGDLPQQERSWETFVHTKLTSPRVFSDDDIHPVMPDYELDDDTALALAVFLRGLRGQAPPAEYLQTDVVDPQLRLAEGLIEERNCRGCHDLDGTPGRISRYYDEDWMAPPTLVGEGARVQPQWLFGFLREPSSLRTWLQLRMPDFRLSEEEAAALVAWFGQGSTSPYRDLPTHEPSPERVEMAAAMFVDLKCVACHQYSAGERASADRAPDLALAPQRLDPAWIAHFLVDPDRLIPGTRMPQFFPDGQTPFPDLLEGDTDAQIELLTEHVMSGSPH